MQYILFLMFLIFEQCDCIAKYCPFKKKKKVKWLGLEVPHLRAHAQVAGTPNMFTNISYWAPRALKQQHRYKSCK